MIRLPRALAPFALAVALAACATPGQPAAVGPTDAPAQAASPTIPLPTAPPPPASATPRPAPSEAPTEPLPTVAPTSAPTEAPTSAPTQAAAQAIPPLPTLAAGSVGAEILFLRDGRLIAYDPARDGERVIAEQVRDFAASADAATLALVRGDVGSPEIWLAARDGAGLRQLTRNQRGELGLSWAPDGMSLAYTSVAGEVARPLDWAAWSSWCAGAEVRVLELASGAERTIGAGCDPAFAPDGRRLAFASPAPPAQGYPGVGNAIRVVNRQGANGWSFASADGNPERGMVVYAPAWSPDAARLAYQRFLGYQALVDITMTELGDSFKGQGAPISVGAGWLLPPAFAPDGRSVAVVEHNYSDARGFAGYDIWELRLLRLDQPEAVAMPSGEVTMQATELMRAPRAAAAAWSPDGASLAVLMPQGWEPGASPSEPLFEGEGPGAIWRWSAAGGPEAVLIDAADYASPLAWLPAPPDVIEAGGVRLAYPRGWGVREPEGPGAINVDGDRSSLAVAAFNLPATAEPAAFFPDLVPAGAELGEPIAMPDGSTYRSFRGRDPVAGEVAGAVRSVPLGEGYTVAALYRTEAARWPLARARAIALLCASGPAPSAQ